MLETGLQTAPQQLEKKKNRDTEHNLLLKKLFI